MYFEFELAEQLKMTVGDLRRRMSGAEFTRWMAYYAEKNARLGESAAKANRPAEKPARLTGRRAPVQR